MNPLIPLLAALAQAPGPRDALIKHLDAHTRNVLEARGYTVTDAPITNMDSVLAWPGSTTTITLNTNLYWASQDQWRIVLSTNTTFTTNWAPSPFNADQDLGQIHSNFVARVIYISTEEASTNDVVMLSKMVGYATRPTMHSATNQGPWLWIENGQWQWK